MRSSKSRSRSKSNRQRSPMGNIVNRVFDSSGPEGKVRGTPQQIIDKYLTLARDAQLSNDRVAAENFQQHAEHYARMLGEAQREMDAARQQNGGGQHQGGNDRQDGEERNGGDENRAERREDRGERRDDREGRRDDREARRDRAESDVIDVGSDDDNGLVETPEMRREAPEAKTPEAKTPEAKTPEAKPSEVKTPEVNGADEQRSPRPRRGRSRAKPREDAPADGDAVAAGDTPEAAS